MNSLATVMNEFPSIGAPDRKLLTVGGRGVGGESTTTSLLETTAMPEWANVVESRLDELHELPENWDTYGGVPVSREVTTYSLAILGAVMQIDTPAPDIVPLPHGGIQMEWHAPDHDLEITIEEPGFASVWSVSPAYPAGREMNFRYDFSDLLEMI